MFPAPVTEETFLFPLNGPGNLVEYQLTIVVWIYFWTVQFQVVDSTVFS